MKPKLYLESTVPSYYVARPSRNIVTAAQQQQTRDWWEQRLKHFDIFVSQIVLDEIGTGDPAMARLRLELVRHLPMLDITQDVLRLTNALVERVRCHARLRATPRTSPWRRFTKCTFC